MNSNPACDFRTAPSYRQYGFETQLKEEAVVAEVVEGTPITWTFFLDDGPFSIENYFLPVAVHEEVLRRAGFRSIDWVSPRLSPQGEREHGLDLPSVS